MLVSSNMTFWLGVIDSMLDHVVYPLSVNEVRKVEPWIRATATNQTDQRHHFLNDFRKFN